MLASLQAGFQKIEASHNVTSSDGTTITASGTANTKGSYTQLIASTSEDAYGVMVQITEVGSNNSAVAHLVDIAIGTSVIIPDLIGGGAASWVSGGSLPYFYYFPLYIPSGSQIQARTQSSTASDTCRCDVFLFQRPRYRPWCGGRVTAYGTATSDSGGLSVTCGNGSFGTAVSLDASTDNPIRYLQMGLGNTDTTMSDQRRLYEIRSGSSTVLTPPLPVNGSGNEVYGNAWANQLLSRLLFDIPAGTDLRVAGMQNGSSNNVHDIAVYGVE